MASKTIYPTYESEPVPVQDEIIVEVRQEIGVVHADPTGKEPMVVAAYRIAAEYLNEQAADGRAAQVEFHYGQVRFTAAAEI